MIELTSHSSWTFMLKQHNAYVSKERSITKACYIPKEFCIGPANTEPVTIKQRGGLLCAHSADLPPHHF
jgi:hypothetical protein